MYVIFPTHVSTKEPIWFHAFVPSQKKSASLRHISQYCAYVIYQEITQSTVVAANLKTFLHKHDSIC